MAIPLFDPFACHRSSVHLVLITQSGIEIEAGRLYSGALRTTNVAAGANSYRLHDALTMILGEKTDQK